MKKRMILPALILLMTSLLFAEDGYEVIFDVPLPNRHVQLQGKRSDGKIYPYEDEKKLVLTDADLHVLDVVDISFTDVAYTGAILLKDDALAFRITIREPYQNCFLYASDTSDTFSRYDCNKWVADGLLTDDYIFYSTEMEADTVKRISLADNSMYVYKGYYPNVTIYPSETGDGILGIFEYENVWYEILYGWIIESRTTYSPEQKPYVTDVSGKKY